MEISDSYVLYSAIIYSVIIICFQVHQLITNNLETSDIFTALCIIVISPLLGMALSILIIPIGILLILYGISKLIYSYNFSVWCYSKFFNTFFKN